MSEKKDYIELKSTPPPVVRDSKDLELAYEQRVPRRIVIEYRIDNSAKNNRQEATSAPNVEPGGLS